MSDRRVKYIILASIIFVGIVGISQGQGLFELNDVNTITPTASLGYLGHVSVFLKDSDGNIKAYRQGDNTVVHAGRDCAADLVFGTDLGSDCGLVDRMAIGSSGASIGPTNTQLFDEATNGKELITSTEFTLFTTASGGNNPNFHIVKIFTILAGDSGETMREAGLFDGSDNLFARTFIGPVAVTTGYKLTIDWTMAIE